MPYLEDPNKGLAMFESTEINKYLEDTYAACLLASNCNIQGWFMCFWCSACLEQSMFYVYVDTFRALLRFARSFSLRFVARVHAV